MIIAVDFDGTLHTGEWPSIGEPMPYAADTMRRLKAGGHRPVRWRCSKGVRRHLHRRPEPRRPSGLGGNISNCNERIKGSRYESICLGKFRQRLSRDAFDDDRARREDRRGGVLFSFLENAADISDYPVFRWLRKFTAKELKDKAGIDIDAAKEETNKEQKT